MDITYFVRMMDDLYIASMEKLLTLWFIQRKHDSNSLGLYQALKVSKNSVWSIKGE